MLTVMTPARLKAIKRQARLILNDRERERIRLLKLPLPDQEQEMKLREQLSLLAYGEIAELAKQLGHSRAYLHDVKNGRRGVSDSLAAKLSALE